MASSGYMSSTSFYILLIITIILIFILCISNIVAYGNILSNDDINFDKTWAKILIAMNAILIVVAFIVMIILIVKFYKGRRSTVPMTAAGGAAAGGTRTNYTVQDLKTASDRLGDDWDTGVTNNGGNCQNPFNKGCSYDLRCSDETTKIPCPMTTGNDDVINRLFTAARGQGYFN